jgi:DNA processing protein
MAAVSDAEWFARTALSCVADPGDPVLGALLRVSSPAEVLAAICAGRAPEPGPGQPGQAAGPEQEPGPEQQPGGPARGLSRALERWAARLGSSPPTRGSRLGAGPGSALSLPVTRSGRPSSATPSLCCCGRRVTQTCVTPACGLCPWWGHVRSTGYGSHVCTEMTAALAQQGWTVISSGP